MQLYDYREAETSSGEGAGNATLFCENARDKNQLRGDPARGGFSLYDFVGTEMICQHEPEALFCYVAEVSRFLHECDDGCALKAASAVPAPFNYSKDAGLYTVKAITSYLGRQLHELSFHQAKYCRRA
jgi:hypothetical protein